MYLNAVSIPGHENTDGLDFLDCWTLTQHLAVFDDQGIKPNLQSYKLLLEVCIV